MAARTDRLVVVHVEDCLLRRKTLKVSDRAALVHENLVETRDGVRCRHCPRQNDLVAARAQFLRLALGEHFYPAAQPALFHI